MSKSFWEHLDEHAEKNKPPPSPRDPWLIVLGVVFVLGVVGWLAFYLIAKQ